MDFVRKFMTLAGGNASILSGTRWALVGLLGIVADLSVFYFLFSQGVGLGAAHIAGFFVATVINYVLNARGSFSRNDGTGFHRSRHQHIAFLIIAMMALFMRGGVLATLIELWGWPTYPAILAAIGAAVVVNYFGSSFFIFSQQGMDFQSRVRWRVAAPGVVCYIVVLRLVYLGLPELLQEEAYYWNYAQHLDIGYLDHPPMVAWLVWLGTTLLGNTEFAVRICASICWLTAMAFSFALTKDLFDKSTAFYALVLIAALPFFFGVGSVMTPDAPLVAWWAGALYFLEQALIRERRLAWWGVGVCIGLGMLSKYTIALLVPATLLFMLLNRPSRRWFLAPEPYMALLVVAFLSSPVIVWNAKHEWASFAFQGVRRLQEPFQFSLHTLIWNVLLLLTPTGVLTVIAIILSKTVAWDDNNTLKPFMASAYEFALVFMLFPLVIFLIFSLAKAVKVQWTGPLWLVMVPFMAWYISPEANLQGNRLLIFLKRAWPPTIVIAMLIYGASLHYLSLGIPGIPYPENGYLLLGWNDLGRQIEQIENELEHLKGAEPLVVGMDKNKIASGLAFYRTKALKDSEEKFDNEGVLRTASGHLFEGESLMYRYWFPEKEQENRDMILVSRYLKDLAEARVLPHVQKMGEVHEITFKKNGIHVGRYYYSIVEGYRSLSQSPGG